MGLAPYGRPIYKDLILEQLIDLKADGSFWLNMDYFQYCQGLTMTGPRFHDLFGGPPRAPESSLEQRHMDLAASIQVVTEEAVLRIGRHVHARTGMRHLVLAGGVALNCVANGRLLRERGSFLGPRFSSGQVAEFLDGKDIPSQRFTDESELVEHVAATLAEGKIVGWFQGRMEFGPRALGARSILGDPRSPAMQATMNLKIKFRESFRPFAPIVLHDRAPAWFDLKPGQESPYMLLVAPVREDRRVPIDPEALRVMQEDPDLRQRVNVVRSEIPAVTHVDYSARLQTVDQERNPRLTRLLEAFERLTGCPVLVNTSFNVRGEPIVCTPEDACRCFLATDMDVLVLEDFVLTKDETTREAGKVAREQYLAQFQLD